MTGQCITVRRAIALAAILWSAGLMLPGCTAAAAGVVFGAAESGSAMIKKGKVSAVVLAREADVRSAVERAGGVLSLESRRVEEQAERTAYFYDEAEGGRVSVYVSRRTDSVTSLIVDVGSFGRPDMARLMYLQVMDELEDAGAFLEEWRPGVLPGAGQ